MAVGRKVIAGGCRWWQVVVGGVVAWKSTTTKMTHGSIAALHVALTYSVKVHGS